MSKFITLHYSIRSGHNGQSQLVYTQGEPFMINKDFIVLMQSFQEQSINWQPNNFGATMDHVFTMLTVNCGHETRDLTVWESVEQVKNLIEGVKIE